MKELAFEIKKHIAVLSTKPSGWTKELNLVSWNGKPAKYDIREWDEEHKTMSKGSTFTTEEIENLREALYDI